MAKDTNTKKRVKTVEEVVNAMSREEASELLHAILEHPAIVEAKKLDDLKRVGYIR